MSLRDKVIPFTLVIWLSRVCKTQKIDFRFLHLEYWNIWALGWCIFSLWPCFFCTCICLYGWGTWYFLFVSTHFQLTPENAWIFVKLVLFFALGNFTFFLDLRKNFIWMEYLRFFFIVSGTEEIFEFEMFCSEELLFSIAGRCPGAQSTFLLQSAKSHKTDSPGKTIRHTMINQESMINKQK